MTKWPNEFDSDAPNYMRKGLNATWELVCMAHDRKFLSQVMQCSYHGATSTSK